MKKAKAPQYRASPRSPMSLEESPLAMGVHESRDLTTEPKVPHQGSPSNRAGAALKASYDDIPEDALPPPRPDPILSLQLSAALHYKLQHQAKDEGISVEALAQEMLAESVVLRAWEIAERKNAMRGPHSHAGSGGPNYGREGQQRPPYGANGQANGNTRHPRGYERPSSASPELTHHQTRPTTGPGQRRPNNAWMEDKAAFLEYVRNQEKRTRR